MAIKHDAGMDAMLRCPDCGRQRSVIEVRLSPTEVEASYSCELCDATLYITYSFASQVEDNHV